MVAEKYDVPRAKQDEYALLSHLRALEARVFIALGELHLPVQ